MAELVPAPMADLVRRVHLEPGLQGSLFELPRRSWYFPRDGDPDLSVRFHGASAGNPVGPAAGPHTQMAQNLLLSYIAGARILELKTVQVNDRLNIPRPCIDMTNVGYNVEWSQELLVEESIREYVAGAMLICMFRRNRDLAQGRLDTRAGDWVFDLSVGYDLAGIRSDKIRRFLDRMRDATEPLNQLRGEIPATYRADRDAEYPTRLSDSITLSTFHGCPSDEIERICELLIGECDFDVIVKMNPPTLGRDHLEHLLHDGLGYTELSVNPEAYSAAISFDESIELCHRLTAFARARNRRLGFKFSNTLEVLNHRDFFTADNKVMYLSGQPLHVITMALTDRFRQAVGPDVPISFSAGIDKFNFPDSVACGFVPVTISTDLLRPGGYGRLPAYLHRLADEMKTVGAENIDAFVLARSAAAGSPVQSVAEAGLINTGVLARRAREDPRYKADRNRKTPKRIDSNLDVFDCITCDKCLPVCPNAANFKYPTEIVAFEYHDLVIDRAGGVSTNGRPRAFRIDQTMQIACYADFCNECGNCDTFCPEYGGPYIEKPSFFGARASFESAAPRDGFYVERIDRTDTITGRIKGRVFRLERRSEPPTLIFDDGLAVLTFEGDGARCLEAARRESDTVEDSGEHVVDMWAFHTMRHLLMGLLDPSRIHQVNARFADTAS